MNPLFTIAIPAYKRRYLKEAIDSCLSQTYDNWELVIVDDASPEDLDSVIKQFSDPRIRSYRNEINFGAIDVVDNWNKCLGYAKGDYIICMGDDDCLSNNCLCEYHRLINKYPNLNVYHAWTEQIDEDGNRIRILEPRSEWESTLALIYYRWRGRQQYIGDFCYSVKHLKENNGYYYLPLAWGADDVTAIRASKNKGIANSKYPIFKYRVSNLTISKSTEQTEIKLKSLQEEKEFIDCFLQNVNYISLEDTDKWYYNEIKKIESHSYLIRMVDVINLEIQSHKYIFFHIIHWLRKFKCYNIPKKYIFYMVYLNIKRMLH